MRLYYGQTFFRVLLLLSVFSHAFASGKNEAAPEPLNKEWTLCISAFDVSGLPPSRQVLGDVLVRAITESLKNVERRFRSGTESEYYQDYAWSKSRAEAAKALETKRNERDVLLFRGDPDWRYKKNLKTVEEQILELEKKLREIEALKPEVSGDPVFKLSDANNNGAAPAPPQEGGEYRFCTSRKADALLTGKVLEFHGRIFVSLKMFTLYTRSYSWEDSVIFSSEDLNAVMDELSGRLVAAVSETLPAAIAVHAKPEDAMVLINGAFAGTGEVPPRDRSPGAVEVAVVAENHAQAKIDVELNAGETTELFIDLSPLSVSAFSVTVPGSPGSSVYLGSLFRGYAPLTLEVPGDQFAYISVEAPSGETGSAVYLSDRVIRGSAEFVREEENGEERDLAFTTRLFPPPEEKRVEKARRAFYTSYGIFWFALPAALLTAAISSSYIDAYNYGADPGMYDKALNGYYATIGGYAAMGASLAGTFFFIFRYLYYSGSDAAPLARFPGQEAER
jgi:hypothetical protein